MDVNKDEVWVERKSTFQQKQNQILLLLIIIFITASLASVISVLTLVFEHLFNLKPFQSVVLSTAFSGLLYCASMTGGWLLATRMISHVWSINLGMYFTSVGLLSLYAYSFLTQTKISILTLCLSSILIGYGLIMPSVISLFGENAKRRLGVQKRYHASFVLNYICMNIGGVVGISFSGLWSTPEGNRNNFLIAFALMGIAAFLFNYLWKRSEFLSSDFLRKARHRAGLLGLILLMIGGLSILLRSPLMADISLVFLTVVTVTYALYSARKMSHQSFYRMCFFVLITAMSMIFFVLYNLEPDVLSLFVEDNVNRHWLGMQIPSATYFMLNPLFNLMFGGLLVLVLTQVKESWAPDIWVYLAIFLMGCGFCVLWTSAHFHNTEGMISSHWIVLAYAVLSAAEMLLSPILYEIVFLYGLPNLYGMMTGISQLSLGLGAFFAQRFALFMVPKDQVSAMDSLHVFARGFKIVGLIWIGIAVLLFLLRIGGMRTRFFQTMLNRSREETSASENFSQGMAAREGETPRA